MLRKHSRILIYDGNTDQVNFDISLVSEVIIKTSRESYTDTAIIRFPNKLRSSSSALDKINIGDKVEIYLGYYPRLIKEFTGYINFYNPDSPLEIQLEDQSFLLKRIALPATILQGTTVKALIEQFYSGPTQILDAEIGDIRIAENATLVKVLDLLKSKYGIISYFQDGILYVNADLTIDNTERVYLVHEQKNTPAGASNLQFQKNNDIPIVSHGVSIQRDGTTIELFATYVDNVLNSDIRVTDIKPIGTLNTIKVPDLSRDALEGLIRRRLPRLFYTGVTGEVVTFGYPSMRHGDTIHYVDDRTPQRNGYYRLIAVTKEFTISRGYKQNLTLGLKTRV